MKINIDLSDKKSRKINITGLGEHEDINVDLSDIKEKEPGVRLIVVDKSGNKREFSSYFSD